MFGKFSFSHWLISFYRYTRLPFPIIVDSDLPVSVIPDSQMHFSLLCHIPLYPIRLDFFSCYTYFYYTSIRFTRFQSLIPVLCHTRVRYTQFHYTSFHVMPVSVIPDSIIPDLTLACYSQFCYTRFPLTVLPSYRYHCYIVSFTNKTKGEKHCPTTQPKVNMIHFRLFVTLAEQPHRLQKMSFEKSKISVVNKQDGKPKMDLMV